MNTTPTMRRLAGGAAILFATTALGGCFELGNGNDPNCDITEAELTDKQQRLVDLTRLGGIIDDLEDTIAAEPDGSIEDITARADLFVAEQEAQALEALFDACDFGEIPR